MITIFRRIREKLIASGNVQKYLLYAIGEILLVVIGILIALQVNNWNEQRKEEVMEQRYLERLIQDLAGDLNEISNSIRAYKSREERARFLLRTIDDPSLVGNDPTYFKESIEYAGYTAKPTISYHTFEEIKSSGRLSIIRNEKIRTDLAAYYDQISGRDQYDFIRQDLQLKYLEKRYGILSPEQQISVGSFADDPEYSTEEAMEVYDRMKNKRDFYEWISAVIQSQTRTRESYENFYDDARELKALIEEELGS